MGLQMNPLVLRIVRLIRIARLMRVLKSLALFDSLRIIIRSMAASTPILLWTAVLLFFVHTLVGMCLNSLLVGYMENHDNTHAQRTEIFKYFGTYSRCIITMTELTLGNFIPVLRCLTDNVNELYGHALVMYKICIGYAMMRVIGGVFLRETYKTAEDDMELMIVQKRRHQAKIKNRMNALFVEADTSRDGVIDRGEFHAIFRNDALKTWLASNDLDVTDVNLLFDLLDDGDQMLTAEELCNGVAHLKGAAKSFDLFCLMHMMKALSLNVSEMNAKLAKI